jgi:hypothetical protein
MHETFNDTAVDFTNRNVIRYKVAAVKDGFVTEPAEVLFVVVPRPKTSAFCRVWGLIQDFEDAPQASIQGALVVPAAGARMVSTAEFNVKANPPITSNQEGFWSVDVPKAREIIGGGALTITIPSTGNTITINLTSVPDLSAAHWSRCGSVA